MVLDARYKMTRSLNRSEMIIPKSNSETIFQIIITPIVIFFSCLAIYSILTRVAVIASSIWLAFIAFQIWIMSEDEGGLNKFFMNWFGIYSYKQFVDINPIDHGPSEIRFGYQLWGFRLFYLKLPIDKIETVEWHTGQATSMAGHDMNDWHVALWYDHDDPDKSLKHKNFKKPDQDVYIVGPSRKKEDTSNFGYSFIDFLRKSGVSLVEGKDEFIFVRDSTK